MFIKLVSIITLLVLSVSINVLYSANAQHQNITKTGIFNYTQIDIWGNSEWVNTGNWSLTKSPTVVITFDAIINMAKPDGSKSHEHRVSDLVIPYAPINYSDSTLITGTTTITMNSGFFISELTYSNYIK